MHKITLFCEDSGLQIVVEAIVHKLFPTGIQVEPLSARHGKGRTLSELEKYFRELAQGRFVTPDAIIAAVDANCSRYNDKKQEVDKKRREELSHIPFLHAIPDPHVERWLLIDSHAFKQVFEKGCSAPDQKCDKDRYKQLLREAIKQAGGVPLLGGLERAEEIIANMDVRQACKADDSFRKFIGELEDLKKKWGMA